MKSFPIPEMICRELLYRDSACVAGPLGHSCAPSTSARRVMSDPCISAEPHRLNCCNQSILLRMANSWATSTPLIQRYTSALLPFANSLICRGVCFPPFCMRICTPTAKRVPSFSFHDHLASDNSRLARRKPCVLRLKVRHAGHMVR